ncbi:alpha/beta hydrolase [Labrenzia sp. CE80]|uniref:alpha/beta fold hydrolase n=1 Tax=Labrenzia sp. CE80 TaxID=1788986 RepID=UPI00129AD4EB|nr:alpha/beta hydrolase [Labrenzia sp. CE80]
MSYPVVLPELFSGFETRRIDCDGCEIHCRTGGDGPPLLLVHGYPQSHAMWHKIAPDLAQRFTLILPDLPGYGQSSILEPSADHHAYSKRAMASRLLVLMRKLGHERFRLVGHDRGARVSYRMALDHPDRIERMAVLDILPTYDYWQRMDRDFALKIYHWAFLAQPAPFPEDLISASSARFLDHTLASWTADKSLKSFSAEALQHYHAFFSEPDRIAATCEDYRAGAAIDVDHDRQDLEAGNKVKAPLLAVWGATGIAQSDETPLNVWERWADDVSGGPIKAGHFVAEENPEELLDMLLPFLEQ